MPSHSVRRMVLTGIALLVVSVGAGCAGQSRGTAAPEATQDRLDSLRAEIQAMIADPTAGSERRCHAIAFGSKPCGGPWTYLVYSAEATDSLALARAVAEYNALEERLNREEGRMSDCSVVSPPAISHSGGRCMSGAGVR